MQDFEITPDSFRSKMSIPKNLEKQYRVAVRAGLLLMFDGGMREGTLQYMDGSEAMPQKIATGIASVVQYIAQESNGTFPGELIIPVGVELIAHAVDVAKKAGVEVDNNDVAESVAAYIEEVLKRSGATPEQMQQIVSGMDSGEQPQGV